MAIQAPYNMINALRAPQPQAPTAPQVGAQPIISPELMARILRGQAKARELESVEAQRVDMQKQRGYAPAEGIESGGVYQSASPLGHLGQLMSAFGKENKYQEISDQAKALRAQAGEGADAATEMDILVQNEKLRQGAEGKETSRQRLFDQMNYKERELDLRERNQELKEEAQRHKVEQDELKLRRSTKDPEVYFNKDTGEERLVRVGDYAMLDPFTGEMIEPGNWRPASDHAIYSQYPKSLTKDIKKARGKYLAVNELNEAGKKLTEAEREELNSPFMATMFETVPPESWVSYLLSNKAGLSPNVMGFLEKGQQAVASMRHDIAGASLTAKEKLLYDLFSPGAVGIDYETRMRRIGNVMDELIQEGDAINFNQDPKKNIYRDFDAYVPYQAKDASQPKTTLAEDIEAAMNTEEGKAVESYLKNTDWQNMSRDQLLNDLKKNFKDEQSFKQAVDRIMQMRRAQ